MIVFEYKQKIKLKKDIPYEKISENIAYFIDSTLGKEERYLAFHNSREYKNYVFDLLFPCEEDKVYKEGRTYSFRIRTVVQDLAEFFSSNLAYRDTNEFKGLGGELAIIQQKVFDKIYSLTPVILKNEQGYWKNGINFEQFEQRLKINLIKKYNALYNTQIEEDIQIYDFIEFKNKVPVKVTYKGKILLGDKIQCTPSKNKMAQDLWYMALGTGIGENNARGSGFVNYRYL